MKKLIKLTVISLLTTIVFSSCNREEERSTTYTFIQNSALPIVSHHEIELIEFNENTRVVTHRFNSDNNTNKVFTARSGSTAVKIRFVMVTVGGTRSAASWHPQVFRLNNGGNINIHFHNVNGVPHEPF